LSRTAILGVMSIEVISRNPLKLLRLLEPVWKSQGRKIRGYTTISQIHNIIKVDIDSKQQSLSSCRRNLLL